MLATLRAARMCDYKTRKTFLGYIFDLITYVTFLKKFLSLYHLISSRTACFYEISIRGTDRPILTDSLHNLNDKLRSIGADHLIWSQSVTISRLFSFFSLHIQNASDLFGFPLANVYLGRYLQKRT